MADFKTIDDLDMDGKVVLTRVDVNVPVEDGRVTDATRIEKIVPTVKDIQSRGGIPVLLAHFDRPKGKRVESMSLKQILPALKQDGSVQRAYLGITSLTIDGSLAAANLPARRGVLVQSVQQGSPAQASGIRAGSLSAQLEDGTAIELGGDIIQRVAGQEIRTSDELATLVATKKPGTKVPVELLLHHCRCCQCHRAVSGAAAVRCVRPLRLLPPRCPAADCTRQPLQSDRG